MKKVIITLITMATLTSFAGGLNANASYNSRSSKNNTAVTSYENYTDTYSSYSYATTTTKDYSSSYKTTTAYSSKAGTTTTASSASSSGSDIKSNGKSVISSGIFGLKSLALDLIKKYGPTFAYYEIMDEIDETDEEFEDYIDEVAVDHKWIAGGLRIFKNHMINKTKDWVDDYYEENGWTVYSIFD